MQGSSKDGYVYVDKTALIYRMVTEGSIYFRGQKELFRGLATDSLEKEWAQYPVFHIDFNEETIGKFLTDKEEVYGKNPNSKSIGNRFIDLLPKWWNLTKK